MQPPHIRWMIGRDLWPVLKIENQCFDEPWQQQDFRACLSQCNCIGMVAVSGETVLGFLIYELHKTRLHLLSVAVAPACHRIGVGTALVRKICGKLSPERRNRVTLEVRETNLRAQLFFHDIGFRATEVLRDWYPDDETTESAYRMEYVHRAPSADHTTPRNRIARHLRASG